MLPVSFSKRPAELPVQTAGLIPLLETAFLQRSAALGPIVAPPLLAPRTLTRAPLRLFGAPVAATDLLAPQPTVTLAEQAALAQSALRQSPVPSSEPFTLPFTLAAGIRYLHAYEAMPADAKTKSLTDANPVASGVLAQDAVSQSPAPVIDAKVTQPPAPTKRHSSGIESTPTFAPAEVTTGTSATAANIPSAQLLTTPKAAKSFLSPHFAAAVVEMRDTLAAAQLDPLAQMDFFGRPSQRLDQDTGSNALNSGVTSTTRRETSATSLETTTDKGATPAFSTTGRWPILQTSDQGLSAVTSQRSRSLRPWTATDLPQLRIAATANSSATAPRIARLARTSSGGATVVPAPVYFFPREERALSDTSFATLGPKRIGEMGDGEGSSNDDQNSGQGSDPQQN